MSKELIDNREPFKAGDRVSHKVFGEGLVEKATRASRHYYHVEVEFDKPSQAKNERPTRFRKLVSTFLEKAPAVEALEVENLDIDTSN